MKKITIFLTMLISMTAFSQIEIIEDFDSTPNNQVPAGWTGNNMAATTNFACGGSGRSIFAYAEAGDTDSITTPNYTGISNGTNLTVSFSYNIFEQVSQFPPQTFTGPASNWGSLVLEYSTDGGATWTNITTIDDSNYTFVDTNTCQDSAEISVGTIANGSDFQARFVSDVVNVSGFRLLVLVDNVSFSQVATTVPNCDSTLISPANGSTDADTDTNLTWQAATGLPTGYTVSVGTTMGGTEIVNAATTTETSYPLTGLSYNTLYYVNIVPFNGVGNATGCIEESFTTRLEPIPGATCSSPLVISSFPYINQNDTNNFEDNIDSSPCSNTYMNGKDVFYEVTPTTDVSINIDLANISNNGPSIHVVDACPDAATECVAYVGTFNSGGSLNLSEVVLLAGNTYFIVLSNSGNTRTYTYDLIITQNSCINPTIDTLTPVADCGNDQFFVDVDISYLGSATSLTLSDDDATSADITNITSTGIVTAGPYASGTLVNFTLTNDQDGSCSFLDSAYFYCPPTNDECGAPIDLSSSINTDGSCTLFTSATNAGATESTTDPDTCADANNNTNDVWFSFVASAETIILEYLNIVSTPGYNGGGTIQATQLLEGSCGALTSIDCWTSNYVTLSNLTIGNTYYIRNNTRLNGEYAQNYDICLKVAPTAPANDECLNADTLTVPTAVAGTELVSGTTAGASLSLDNSCETSNFGDVWYVLNPTVTGVYEFSIAKNPTGQTGSISHSVYEGSCGALTALIPSCTSSNTIVNLTSGSTYYVMVQSSLTNPGITFDLDVTRLPDAVSNSDCSSPDVLLESPDMNGTNSISGNINVTDVAYYSPEGCASSSNESVWFSFTPQYTGIYNFDYTRDSGTSYYKVYNTDDCSSTATAPEVPMFGTSCFNSADKTGELVAGNTYLIMVFASGAAEFTLFAYPDPSLSVESQDFETFSFYPNPVANILNIKAKNTISTISVFNVMGQEVKNLSPDNSETTLNMNNLNKGIYFVSVTINNSQKTFKVIKR
ncbi:T9SS type A sorting domain-containing protein [Lacinutrix chionoecetis]